MTTATREQSRARRTNSDTAESVLRNIDDSTTEMVGVSLFHILTIAAIATSVALFMNGRQMAGIFVGLWPPTFQALKSAAEDR